MQRTSFTFLHMPQNHADRRLQIEARESSEPSLGAVERKKRSILRLKHEGVPTIEHLPVIADSNQAKLRTVDEVAQRAIAVCLTALKGEGLDGRSLKSAVKQHGASTFFSPRESAFINDPRARQEDRLQFSWRYECYWVLLWALGYVGTLERPEDICDVAKAVLCLRDRANEEFIRDARLRSISDILDEADLIYRYNWAVVNARIKGEEPPAQLVAGVVVERHYALNWLIGYMDQEWDDISTDT
jgi:hypothetical protein